MGFVVPVLVVDTVVLSDDGVGEQLDCVSPQPPFRKDTRPGQPARGLRNPLALPLALDLAPQWDRESIYRQGTPSALPVKVSSLQQSHVQVSGGARECHQDASQTSSVSPLHKTVPIQEAASAAEHPRGTLTKSVGPSRGPRVTQASGDTWGDSLPLPIPNKPGCSPSTQE